MKKINKLIIFFILIFVFNGCNENNNDNNNTSFTKSNIKKLDYKDDNKKLSKIGIYKEKGKIIIDINQTKSFLNKIAKTLKKEAKDIHEKKEI